MSRVASSSLGSGNTAVVSLPLVRAVDGAPALKTWLTAWLMMCHADPNLYAVPSPIKTRSRTKCNPTVHRQRQGPKLSSLEKKLFFPLLPGLQQSLSQQEGYVCASPVAAGWVLEMRSALVTAPVALLVLPSLCRRRFRAVVVSTAVLSHPISSTGCA